jgi:hypothetical protein
MNPFCRATDEKRQLLLKMHPTGLQPSRRSAVFLSSRRNEGVRLQTSASAMII